MIQKIELPPDVERRLAEEAARRGQNVEELAIAILQTRLAAPDQEPDQPVERTPEHILSDFSARFPRRSPDDLAELARQQGVQPVARFEDLLGEGPAGGDEFDIDDFHAARKQWQRDRRPLVTHNAPDSPNP